LLCSPEEKSPTSASPGRTELPSTIGGRSTAPTANPRGRTLPGVDRRHLGGFSARRAQPAWRHPSATPETTCAPASERVSRWRNSRGRRAARRRGRGCRSRTWRRGRSPRYRIYGRRGDLDLRADAVGAGDQHRIPVVPGGESEESRERADLPSTSLRCVERTIGLIRRTRRSPSSMSTPALLYVTGFFNDSLGRNVPHGTDLRQGDVNDFPPSEVR